MSLGIVFHAAAALAYALLGGMLAIKLARGASIEQTGWAARTGLLAAIALQGAALYESMLGAGTGLYLSWSLALSAAVWLGLVVYWLESLLVRIDSLQLLLLPVATVLAALAAIWPSAQTVPHGDSRLLLTHLLIALTAYGLITIAALHAMLMALLDRRLHRPPEDPFQRGMIGNILDSQPPLLVQEQLLFRIIWLGFVVLTLAVGSGSFTSIMLTGKVLPFDHKTVFTLLSWLTFGGLLMGRQIRGWRGRIALRWTLAGFAFLILAYTGSRFALHILLHRS